MHVDELVGKVSRDPPKDVSRLSQQLLLRSGLFLWTPEEILILHGGSILLDKLVSLFTLGLNASQKIQYASSFKELLQSEFNSYRSLPRRFYRIMQCHTPPYIPLGMLSPSSQPVLEVNFLCEDIPVEDISNVFQSLGIQTFTAHTSRGYKFLQEIEGGQEEFLVCSGCGYSAIKDVAEFKRVVMSSPEKPLTEVETPGCKTIEEVTSYLGVSPSSSAKAIFYRGSVGDSQKLIFAIVRGDYEVSEKLLSLTVGVDDLVPATDSDILKIGAVPGYASPIGIDRERCIVVVDPSVSLNSNFVVGANKEGYHLINCNYPRDFSADIEAEIALADAGCLCTRCGGSLSSYQGVVLGEVESLPSEVFYSSSSGKPSPIDWNRLKIFLFSLVGAIAEENYDQFGIILPPAVSPWLCIVLPLHSDPTCDGVVTSVLQILDQQKIPYLFDSRKGKPGHKFMEADLRGVPIRLVISKKNLGMVEVKRRGKGDSSLMSVEELTGFLLSELSNLPQ